MTRSMMRTLTEMAVMAVLALVVGVSTTWATEVDSTVVHLAAADPEIQAALDAYSDYIQLRRKNQDARPLWHPDDRFPVYDWEMGYLTWRGRNLTMYVDRVVDARRAADHVELDVEWSQSERRGRVVSGTWRFMRVDGRMVGVSALSLHTQGWEERRVGNLVVHWSPARIPDWRAVSQVQETVVRAYQTLGGAAAAVDSTALDDMHVYVCRSEDEVGALFDRSPRASMTHLRNSISATTNEFSAHELIHILLGRMAPGTRPGRSVSSPIAEGIAYALGGGTWLSSRCLLSWAAQLYTAGKQQGIGTVLQRVGANDLDANAAEAAAFVQFLLDQGTGDRMLRLYNEFESRFVLGHLIESAYGRSWTDLEPAFHETIASTYAPTIDAGPLAADAATMVAFRDPPGDDVGDGDYVYPPARDLEPGALDLLGFRVTHGADRVGFEIELRALGGTVSPWGFRGPLCRIGIQRDGDAHLIDHLGAGARAQLRDGIDLVIDVSPDGVLVRTAAGQWLDILQYPTGEPLATGSLIAFSVPDSLIGTPTEAWRYQVITTYHLPAVTVAEGVGTIASVAEEARSGVGGGGDPGQRSPNLYDLLTPAGVDQAALLSSYASDGQYVRLPLVP